MAGINIKKYVSNYFSKKKWYSILSDAIFVIIIALLIIPSTRTDVSSFFIRLTSLPPSTLDSDEQFNISQQTKSWQILDMEGNPVKFSELNEKPVFISFWATWCPPCVAELPGIADLYEKYQDDVNFILVSSESRAKVRAFAKKSNLYHLPFYQNTNVPSDFSSQSIPTTFILNRDGIVVVSKKGAARWNSGSIEEVIEELISE